MDMCLNCIYSYYRHYYISDNRTGDGSYHCDQYEIDVAETDCCSDYIERSKDDTGYYN